MNFLLEAYSRLYPGTSCPYEFSLKHSGRFKGYNAIIQKRGGQIAFRLSRQWKGVDVEIKIGLVQVLLLKILKDKRETTNTQLYNYFIKSLHISAEKTVDDPRLQESFERVSQRYFNGMVEMPSIAWGSDSRRKLASYEYQTDQLTISNLFKNAGELELDYLMYHELLHKKLKYSDRNGRSYHHTPQFRRLEQQYEGFREAEKRCQEIVRKKRGLLRFLGF